MSVHRFLKRIIWIVMATVFCAPVWAASHPLRPLVFIPGILGSKLCDSKGHVVWGNATSLTNLSSLSLAGPHPRTDISSCGVITEIQILGPIWAVHQYDGLLAILGQLGYREGENLFIFDYDWRLSNFDNAKRLATFIHQKLPGNTPYDIVAHSMGGIIARIYIHDAGTEAGRIHLVFFMGTPFQGSVNTFGALAVGWGALENVMAGGKNAIRQNVLSYPGFLELLPRYEHCCYVREPSGEQRFLNIFQVSTWQTLSWLPSGLPSGPADQTFADNLKRAASLDEYLRVQASPGIREVKVAGDAHSTRFYVGMPASDTRPEAWKFTMTGGDGTVPVESAANNLEFDSLAGTLQSFAEHATLFDDKWVQAELARELTNVVPPRELAIAGPGNPTLRVKVNGKDHVWTIDSVDLVPNSPTVSNSGDIAATLTLTFNEPDQLAQHTFLPTAMASLGHDSESMQVDESTTQDDLGMHRLRYAVHGYRAKSAGVVDISVNLGAINEHGYVAVLP